MGFPAGFGIVHILNLSGPGFHGEGAFASTDRSPVMFA
jgi:hypothetical protein